MGVVNWSNGRLYGPDDLLLSGVDHGVTVGDGVFETCAVYDGTAFALTRHLRRLRRSALGIGLGEPDLDLVRNDLQRVCVPGTVEVTTLLGEEHHPGLVHLVSTVQGVLDDEVAHAPDLWARLLDATYPPGSVSGAPKSSALEIIAALETVPRGPYCGAVGWIEVGTDGSVRAELAVGIRTFWWADDVLRFGTGAGITWGSDPEREWAETELKAARLVGLASGVAAETMTD